jgi:hypothetical protein
MGCGYRAVLCGLLVLADFANMWTVMWRGVWLWALLLICDINARNSSQDVEYVLQGWLK